MAEIAGIDVGVSIPSLIDKSFSFYLLITLVVVGVFLVLALVLYMWYMTKIYNKKIVVFENIAGKGWVKSGTDSARLIKVGNGGEEILYLRKRKVYRAAYGRKMGKNEFWFAIGQDGYWYNFILGDLDAKMGMLDIEPIDRDMRYMHVAIRKNAEERYRKIGFMEKYGTMILLGIYMIGFFIGTWFLLDQLGEIASQLISSLDANQKVVETLSNIVGQLDIINNGGSGIIPAG